MSRHSRKKTSATLLFLLAGLLLNVSLGGAAQAPFLIDDFNGSSIDTTRWKVTLPYANSTALENNGSLELFRRGIIDAQTNFPSAIDIEGRFRFTGDADTFSIVFRSDLTVTNAFERRGVQAALQQTVGRVFLIPEPFVGAPITGSYLMGRDTNINFRVTDNGETVKIYLDDFFQPVVSATITNRRGNRLSLYNFNGPTSRVRLDQITVYPLQTAVFLDDQLIRTDRVQRSTSSRVKLQSVYTNSSMFYTLDGATPSFISTEYSGPFFLSNSVTIRAIAYTADFLTSSESAPVQFDYLPLVRLTNETRGGGVIAFDPPGPFFSNQVTRLTALPGPGWQFLRWEGALDGTAVTNLLTMTNHLAVRAVFGTTLSPTLVGAGRLQTSPAGPVFEYGVRARLQAVPDAGQYFVRWANAVTGTVSPSTLILTNAAPAVSVLFSALGAGQVSLTVLVDGAGTVGLSPAANVFTNGQRVTLTGRPDPDQVLLGWTGAITASTNPISLVLNGSTNVTARFAPGVRFTTGRLDTNGFSLSLSGVPGFIFNLERSTNLVNWGRVAMLTNVTGLLTYQDRGVGTPPLQGFYRVTGE